MLAVRIQLLGPLRAWLNGDELDLGGPKPRAVLGLLAFASASGHPVSRSELVDALWGQRPPLTASNVIQTYIKQVRNLLEPDRSPHAPGRLLRRVAGGYELELSSVDLDLVEFRRLVTAALEAHRAGELRLAADRLSGALGLWQGPPLANAAFLDQHPRVVALSDERWTAVALFGEAMLATGGAAKALPVLEEAAGACPLDEAAQTRLIRAYHALGQRGRAFATYRAVHRRLADELGVDPGPELAAAHEAMLAEDREQGTRRRSVVPAQLPTATSRFAGRADQLRQLDLLLSTHESAQPVVISGAAGIGKTALVVHWAHQVARRFPDGQLFVNLRGFEPTGSQMSRSEAVRTLLDELRVPAQSIPGTVEAQVNLYRDIVAGKRLLIVLDNARDPEQVRPLLPGSPGCLVLVTSRNQLTGLGVS